MRKLVVLLLLSLMLVNCSALETNSSQQCKANTSRLLPSNQVPEGSSLRSSRFANNDFEAISFDTVNTSLGVTSLFAHYNEQTAEDARWLMMDAEQVDNMAWSTWKVIDECGDTWNGLLIVTKVTPSADPFVTFRVSRQE